MKLILDDGTTVELDEYGNDAFGNTTWIGSSYVVTCQGESS